MMRTLSRLAIKDLWFHRQKMLWMIFFLGLAFFSALLSLSFKSSIQRYVYQQARSTLSADLSLSSLQPMSEKLRDRLNEQLKPTQTASTIDFRSMISAKGGALLCEIRAIDSLYPLTGSITRSPEGSNLEDQSVAYVYPEVLAQLKLKLGDSILIGRKEFRIESVVLDDPGATSRIFSFTPRVYIHKKYANDTGLVSAGSQIFHREFYLLSKPLTPSQVGALQQEFQDEFFLSTPEDSLDILKRFFGVFEKTIYLLSLSVVLMSLFVSFTLFQNFLRQRMAQVATLKMFGIQTKQLMVYFSIQLLCLGLVAFVLASCLLPWVAALGESWIQSQGLGTFVWNLSTLDLSAGLLGALILCLVFVIPAYREISQSRIAQLFASSSGDEQGTIEFSWKGILPIVACVFALTVWLTQSLKLSLGIIALLGLLVAATLGLRWILIRALLSRKTTGSLHLALVNLSKPRFSVTLSFIAISFVSFFIQVIPHIESSLENQLKVTQASDLPALFVFNIPEDEIDPLSSFIQKQGADTRYVSPMIPARLIKVNGQDPAEKRLRQFPVRLSYRDQLLSSEKVIQKIDPTPGVAALSLEKEFAERSKLKIGDRLQFDILGVPIEGQATSIREVDWLKFHPAFFIQFEPGHLEDAPKTLIASVYSNDPAQSQELLLKTLTQFPTVSVLDIRRTLDRVLSIIKNMAYSLEMASLLSLSLVAFTFLGLLIFSLWNRRYEASVMIALGGRRKIVSRVFVYEYLLLGLMGGFVGFVFSALGVTALVRGVFEFDVELSWLIALGTAGVIGLTCAALGSLVARNLILRGLR
jgi:putative ABC transport system permease protein